MTEKTAEWYQKELGDRFQHFYMLLDGSYNFPNSLEGDLLKMTHNMLTLMEKEKNTSPFAVGEYYQTTRKGRQYIFRVSKEYGKNLPVKCLALDSGWFSSDCWIIRNMEPCTPATAEQIVTFHRAEQFAKHGRKLDEFRVGDVVRDEYGGTYKVTAINNGALYYCPDDIAGMSKECDLIQTAEELQEVIKDD